MKIYTSEDNLILVSEEYKIIFGCGLLCCEETTIKIGRNAFTAADVIKNQSHFNHLKLCIADKHLMNYLVLNDSVVVNFFSGESLIFQNKHNGLYGHRFVLYKNDEKITDVWI